MLTNLVLVKEKAPKKKETVPSVDGHLRKKKKTEVAASYNRFKQFNGKFYTGAKVGRKQKWYYDKGEWKEQKVTPDQWEFNYSVTKRRAGHAPKGSGAPVGTEYHWYILADQLVKKLNADDYSTAMSGLKFKLAHKRFDKETWSSSDKSQHKALIKILQGVINDLEKQLKEMEKRQPAKKTTPGKKSKKNK